MALEGKKVVITAAPSARKLTADVGASLVDHAHAGLPVQKSAHRAEVLVALMTEHALAVLVAALRVSSMPIP